MTVLHSIDVLSSNSEPAAIKICMPPLSFAEHHNEFYEILIVEQGAGVHVFNGDTYTLNSGCVCFVRSNDRHLFESTDALFLTSILFIAPDAFRFLSGVEYFLPYEYDGVYHSHWRINYQVLQQIRLLTTRLREIPHSEQAEDIALYESIFMQLLVQLWQGCREEVGDDQEGRLCQLIDWLQCHYMEVIEWPELSARFTLPLRTLHRQLKNYTGMTPQRYLIHLRLLQARYQLCHSDISITDIAYQCGFGSSNHFSTVFKRAFSQSPRALRYQVYV